MPREVRKRERREFMSRAEFAVLFQKEREARSDESELCMRSFMQVQTYIQ